MAKRKGPWPCDEMDLIIDIEARALEDAAKAIRGGPDEDRWQDWAADWLLDRAKALRAGDDGCSTTITVVDEPTDPAGSTEEILAAVTRSAEAMLGEPTPDEPPAVTLDEVLAEAVEETT